MSCMVTRWPAWRNASHQATTWRRLVSASVPSTPNTAARAMCADPSGGFRRLLGYGVVRGADGEDGAVGIPQGDPRAVRGAPLAEDGPAVAPGGLHRLL